MRGFPFATDKRSFTSLDLKVITWANNKICGVWWPMGGKISLNTGFIQLVKEIVLL